MIGATIGAIAGAIIFAIAAVFLAIPMIVVGFFSEIALNTTMDVVGRLIVYGSIAIGIAVGGSLGSVSSTDSDVTAIVMALIALALIGIGIANSKMGARPWASQQGISSAGRAQAGRAP